MHHGYVDYAGKTTPLSMQNNCVTCGLFSSKTKNKETMAPTASLAGKKPGVGLWLMACLPI